MNQKGLISIVLGALFLILELFLIYVISRFADDKATKIFLTLVAILGMLIGVVSIWGIMSC